MLMRGERLRGLTRRALVVGPAAAAVAGSLPAAGRAAAFEPTSGGQNGRVIEVTTLADAGPGSLRAALEATGPRRIIFSVAGEIWPASSLVIREPFVTVDGASAPKPGITLMGQRIRIRAHDVILRHLRIRIGARADGFDPQNRDALAIDGGEGGADPSYNVLVENCSLAWAVDENLQIWGAGCHRIAIRRCLIAEGLQRSIHPKGRHSMGLIVGPGVTDVLIEQNLFAHNAVRNPVIHGGATAVVVNNLIYAPETSAFHVYPDKRHGPTRVSVIGNVVIAGPDTRQRLASLSHGVNPGTALYLRDNLSVGVRAFLDDERPGRDGAQASPFVHEPPISLAMSQPMPATQVEAHVIAHAGALPDARDATDRRIVSEVRSRSGRIKDEPEDPRLRAGAQGR
jgi:hypothetical protein